jgi:hypothetical protein
LSKGRVGSDGNWAIPDLSQQREVSFTGRRLIDLEFALATLEHVSFVLFLFFPSSGCRCVSDFATPTSNDDLLGVTISPTNDQFHRRKADAVTDAI